MMRATGLSRLRHAGPLAPLALSYHGVADVALRDDPHRLFVSPDLLRRHIARLRRWGYELVTFSEFAHRVQTRRAAAVAALTFDDGFADNAVVLAPLLAGLRAPATVFVTAGWLGRAHPDAPFARILTAEQLQRLARDVEIGSHTMWHRDLSTVDHATALADFRASRRVLQGLVDQPVDVAAYPYGRATEDTRRACRDAGFVAACRTAGDGSWDDPWDLPRQAMGNASTLAGLRLKRDGRYEPLMASTAPRAARRARLVVQRLVRDRLR